MKYIILLLICINISNAQSWKQVKEIADDVYVHSIFYPKNDAKTMLVLADSIPIDKSNKSIFPSYFAQLIGYGYYQSNDGGVTFPTHNIMNNYIMLSMSETNDNKWIASVLEKNINKIGFSVDKGKTWDFESSECALPSKILNFLPLENSIVGAAVSTGYGYVESDNNFIGCERNDTLNVSIRDIKRLNNKIFFTSDDNAKGGVYFSNNLGDSWKKDQQGLSGLRINTVCPSPAYDVYNYVVCGADKYNIDKYEGAGIYISSDNGDTWKLQGASNAKVYDIEYHPKFPLLMVAACGTDGVFLSTNGGLVWSAMNTGLPEGFDVRYVSIPNKDISSDGYEIYLGVFGKGLWKSSGINFTLVSVDKYELNSLEITSVGPNPFENNFEMYLNSNTNELVDISIIDLKGETILERKDFINKGSNLLSFRNLDFNSGMYFLSVNSSQGIVNYKLIKK